MVKIGGSWPEMMVDVGKTAINVLNDILAKERQGLRFHRDMIKRFQDLVRRAEEELKVRTEMKSSAGNTQALRNELNSIAAKIMEDAQAIARDINVYVTEKQAVQTELRRLIEEVRTIEGIASQVVQWTKSV